MSRDHLPELPERLRIPPRPIAMRPSSDTEQALLLVPNLVRLLYGLLRDRRVPRRDKAVALLALGYVVTPVDLIPDAIPGLGRIDDLLVVAAALHRLLRAAGPEAVAAHWHGRADVLEVIELVLARGADALPRRLRARRAG